MRMRDCLMRKALEEDEKPSHHQSTEERTSLFVLVPSGMNCTLMLEKARFDLRHTRVPLLLLSSQDQNFMYCEGRRAEADT